MTATVEVAVDSAARHSDQRAEKAWESCLDISAAQLRHPGVATIDLSNQAGLTENFEVVTAGRFRHRKTERRAMTFHTIGFGQQVTHNLQAQWVRESCEDVDEFQLVDIRMTFCIGHNSTLPVVRFSSNQPRHATRRRAGPP